MVLCGADHVQGGSDAEQDIRRLPLLPHLRSLLCNLSKKLPLGKRVHRDVGDGLHYRHGIPMYASGSVLGQEYYRQVVFQRETMVDVLCRGTDQHGCNLVGAANWTSHVVEDDQTREAWSGFCLRDGFIVRAIDSTFVQADTS